MRIVCAPRFAAGLQLNLLPALKRFLKILRNSLLILLGVAVLAAVLVNLTPVQNFLASRAAAVLGGKLKTRVSVAHVRIDLLNHMVVQGLYIEDRQGDTLLYAGEARVRITDWFFLKDATPVISYAGLKHAYSHLYRTPGSRTWNYQFVIDAFDTGPKKKKSSSTEFEADLEKLELDDVRIFMDDAWSGNNTDMSIGSGRLLADDIDVKKKIIDLSSVSFSESSIAVKSYKGGKPKDTAKKKEKTIDSTAFNPDNWTVRVENVTLEDCRFIHEATVRPPKEREFDPGHMDIYGLDFEAEAILIRKDTLTAHVSKLSGRERCGFELKNLSADARVSPNEGILDHLLLETPTSRVRDRYAMHYRRFPDFLDYIDKVRMVASLRNSVVSAEDLGFFAPVFREWGGSYTGNGSFDGTVANFTTRDFSFSDGASSVAGAALQMTGLPDIYNTFIHFTGGHLRTAGPSLFRYAPELRAQPHLALGQLSRIAFDGSFTGYIENFAANGTLQTNLGDLRSEAVIRYPVQGGGVPTYSGQITTAGFDIGTLFREPTLRSIAFSGKVSGSGATPSTARVQVDADVSAFGVMGYTFRNISTDGVLSQGRFEGNLFINDSNLAATFSGVADFSGKEPAFNATAHVLNSDLRKLGLARERTTFSADFDLAARGATIDNFLGTGKLYNVNLAKQDVRLDIDSVVVQSSLGDGGLRSLHIESNVLQADVEGRYRLSRLPASVQYFLSQYMPAYIPAPAEYAPDQDLTFNIKTLKVDALLHAFVDGIRGFDGAVLHGSLNTGSSALKLTASVPYGEVYGAAIRGATVTGDGTYSGIAVVAEVDNLSIGDSLVNLSASLRAALGHDSVAFGIETASPLSFGTASLNGSALARGDSLRIALQPSGLFINSARWEIPGGSEIVYRPQSLFVNNLQLNSGLQKILVQTEEGGAGTLRIDATAIDLSGFSAIADLASYNPDGRASGMLRIEHPMKDPFMQGSITVTGLRLGQDTVGNVVLSGDYNSATRTLELQPGSGIFRNGSSLVASGTVRFDSTSGQRIDAKITANEAPLAWLQPLLKDYVSNLGGKLNGSVHITGTGAAPDVDGSIALRAAKLRIDYLGTTYTIPGATIGISNKAFLLGRVEIFDVFSNAAILSGSINHNRLRDFRFALNVKSDEFQVLNLRDYENPQFYGNVVAETDLSISGPLENLNMRIKAKAAAASQLYLPVTSGTGTGAYNYVSFMEYGQAQVEETRRGGNKLSVTINAIANPLLEIIMIIDPATGDRISARGNGSLRMEIPAGQDIRLYGNYVIDAGTYTFTFRQLFYTRDFAINSGSRIAFSGPVSQIDLGISALYRTRASLYDLLTDREKQNNAVPQPELADTKRLQDVDVILRMVGKLQEPVITFKVDLPEKRSVGNYAYQKLERINTSERELFDQVASLLLIGYFIPPEGLSGSSAVSGSVNNLGEILSTTTSKQLTNVINKITGDPKLSVELKYKNYNLSDGSASILNRNEVKLGVRRAFFRDRLVVEVGSAYDWGRPTTSASTSTANLNILGDFRLQYLLSGDGRIRLNAFRTSNFDAVAVDVKQQNVSRGGVGISYRRSFDNFSEFFASGPSKRRILEAARGANTVDSAALKGEVKTGD